MHRIAFISSEFLPGLVFKAHTNADLPRWAEEVRHSSRRVIVLISLVVVDVDCPERRSIPGTIGLDERSTQVGIAQNAIVIRRSRSEEHILHVLRVQHVDHKYEDVCVDSVKQPERLVDPEIDLKIPWSC